VAAIRASAEILEEGALDEPDEARRFVGRIRESVARIERLLKELLSLARIEAHGAEQFEPVQVTQLVRRAIDAVSNPSRVTLTSHSSARIRGEPGWLSRAVSNLVENGLTHSAADTPVEVSIEETDGALTIVVESAGSVEPHVRSNLFRRFVTTREDKGGTGLGLAIVRAVAEAHGGQVTLNEAGPPKVRFALRLPRPQGPSLLV
jgi:signal transduction histidine kinase